MRKLVKTGILAAGVALCACNSSNTPATIAAAASPAAASASAGGASAPAAGQPAEAGAPEAANAGSAADRQDITIPAGTRLPIVLDTAVASDTSRAEQPVRAHLSRAVVVRGRTALPQGSQVSGVVTEAVRSGKVKGRAHLAMRFDSVVPRGADERYTIRTASVGRTAAATKEKDALKIAAPAAGGAIIGRIVGGRKGALVGAGVGGGAGTAYVLSTRGEEVRLRRNAPLTITLTEPVTVRIGRGR